MKFYTYKQVADRCGVNYWAIYNRTYSGKLPTPSVGGRLFTEEQVSEIQKIMRKEANGTKK